MPLYHLRDWEFIRLIKKNSIIGTILLLLPFYGFSQADTITHKNELKILLSIPQARTLEFWGQRGLICKELVPSLETRIEILQSKLGFYEMINRNCVAAQEEYRVMVQNAAGVNAKLERELSDKILEADKWRYKARNRGQALIMGAVVLGIVGYIQIAN